MGGSDPFLPSNRHARKDRAKLDATLSKTAAADPNKWANLRKYADTLHSRPQSEDARFNWKIKNPVTVIDLPANYKRRKK